MLNICVCLKGGSSSVTFIKKKIAAAAMSILSAVRNRPSAGSCKKTGITRKRVCPADVPLRGRQARNGRQEPRAAGRSDGIPGRAGPWPAVAAGKDSGILPSREKPAGFFLLRFYSILLPGGGCLWYHRGAGGPDHLSVICLSSVICHLSSARILWP